MKSPFPGMDPYIESCGLWEGFHDRLVHRIDETLSPLLPEGYFIDTAVRTYVVMSDSGGPTLRRAKPDVTIARARSRRRKNGGVAVADALESAEPVPMQAFAAEEIREPFVEIYAQRKEPLLVTCIEVLSPANKRPGSEGWLQYERKRRAMLMGQANFIEIDLLRDGVKQPMLTAWPASPYTLLVSRQADAPSCQVWQGHFLCRLPPIPVPLLSPDPDLSLDLQPLIDHIYALGRYQERIDYNRPLVPALSDAEARSVRPLLQRRSARPSTRRRRS